MRLMEPPPQIEGRSKKARSRTSNGKCLLVGADRRGAWARRFRDLVELHIADLGGSETLSEAQRSLVRRAATIETELERFEGLLSQGQEVDLDVYGRSAGQLRRILESLGLQRRSKEIAATMTIIHKSADQMTDDELAAIARGDA